MPLQGKRGWEVALLACGLTAFDCHPCVVQLARGSSFATTNGHERVAGGARRQWAALNALTLWAAATLQPAVLHDANRGGEIENALRRCGEGGRRCVPGKQGALAVQARFCGGRPS